MEQFNGWMASLSNGETVVEKPPIPGEKSSWQKLLDRLKEEDLKITQLRLRRNGQSIVCDGHKGIQGYCMAYEALRIFWRDTQTTIQGVGSVYNDVVFMTWVDDNGTVRQDIRPLDTMRINTTLRDADDRTKGNV